jgi:hypothetical protein
MSAHTVTSWATSVLLAYALNPAAAPLRAADEKPKAQLDAKQFELSVTPIVSLEGGPVVFRATLTYTGQSDLHIYFYPKENVGIFDRGNNWESVSRAADTREVKGDLVDRVFSKGETITLDIPVHLWHSNIKSGKVRACVYWSLYDGLVNKTHWLDRTAPTVGLEKDFELVVEKRTKDSISKVCAMMDRILDKPKTTDDDLELLENMILDTTIPEFFDRAMRVIDQRRGERSQMALVRWIRDVCDSEEHRLAITDYLCGDRPSAASAVMAIQFVSTKKPLSAANMERLCRAKNVWVRALAYAINPTGFAPKDKSDLLKQLTSDDTLTVGEVAAIVRRFNADKFKDREAAMKELLGYGGRALPGLDEIRKGMLNAEERQRVEKALEQIRKAGPDILEVESLKFITLESRTSKPAQEIVRAVAAGPPDRWRTKWAKEELSKMSNPNR